MGKESAEQIAQEIEALRVDTDRVLTELDNRLGEAMNVRAQAERHPVALGTAGLALIGALGFGLYTIFTRSTHQTPGVSGRIEHGFHSARKAVTDVNYGGAGRPATIGDGLIKRVLWTFLATVLVTMASFAARKFSASIWSSVMHERPPKK